MNRRRFAVAASVAAAFMPRLVAAQETIPGFTEYAGRTLAVNDMLIWFFTEESQLMQAFDQSNLLDQDWQIDVLAPFSIPKAAQSVLTDTEVPALMQESHDYLTESVEYLVDAEPFMRDGILNVNADSLALAADLVGMASDALDKASAALPNV